MFLELDFIDALFIMQWNLQDFFKWYKDLVYAKSSKKMWFWCHDTFKITRSVPKPNELLQRFLNEILIFVQYT